MTAETTHLVHHVAACNGITHQRAAEIVHVWLEIMHRTLAAGEDIAIRGFGRFSVKKRKQKSVRNFSTAEHLAINPGNTVVFRASSALKTFLNDDDEVLEEIGPSADRRGEERIKVSPKGRAVVRVAGIPVYEFGIRDTSEGGTCLIVEDDPTLLRNIRVGQEIDLMISLEGDTPSAAVFQRSEVRHITHASDGPEGKVVLIGVKILSRLPR